MSEEINQFESPIKKGDFLTMSQLQNKLGNIPEDETVSQECSVNNSQLTYSQSQGLQSSLFNTQNLHSSSFQNQMQKIDEVSESQHSVFSIENNPSEQIDEKDRVIYNLKIKNYEYQQNMEELKSKLQQKDQEIEDLKSNMKNSQETEAKLKEQLLQQQSQLSEIKSNKKLQSIIDDQNQQIKQLHKYVQQSRQMWVIDKVRKRYEAIKQETLEIDKLFLEYDKLEKNLLNTKESNRSQNSLYYTEN
ncbi:hypothetical protein pb186bvf_016558 [Paramecium bursaria]